MIPAVAITSSVLAILSDDGDEDPVERVNDAFRRAVLVGDPNLLYEVIRNYDSDDVFRVLMGISDWIRASTDLDDLAKRAKAGLKIQRWIGWYRYNKTPLDFDMEVVKRWMVPAGYKYSTDPETEEKAQRYSGPMRLPTFGGRPTYFSTPLEWETRQTRRSLLVDRLKREGLVVYDHHNGAWTNDDYWILSWDETRVLVESGGDNIFSIDDVDEYKMIFIPRDEYEPTRLWPPLDTSTEEP